MAHRDEHNFQEHDDLEYIENLEKSNPTTRKKTIANRRRIDEIIEARQLEEDIGDIDYLLSHRNRHKIHKKDRKRRE